MLNVDALSYVSLASIAMFGVVAALVISSRYAWQRRCALLKRLELSARTSPPGWERNGFVSSIRVGTLRRLLAEAPSTSPARRFLAAEILRRAGLYGATRDWLATLQLLEHANRIEFWGLVRPALLSRDQHVVGATITLLGRVADRRAAILLTEALTESRFSRSRIATALDTFPVDIPDIIRPMLTDADPQVRYWATLLMRRYPFDLLLADQLLLLVGDEDALVRKAALVTYGRVGGDDAIAAARERLEDPVPFVRAQAARTLAALDRLDEAPAIAELLADKNWWVRLAAKQSLERFGREVEPVLLPWLSQEDDFARNGAAEVLQAVGVFEELVRAEIGGPRDAVRVAFIAGMTRAGGVGMWDAVIPKLPPGEQSQACRLAAGLTH